MDPASAVILENVLTVRARLIAHATAVWIAARAVDRVIGELPPTTAPGWRGPAAQAEARRVQELSDALRDIRARLAALSDRLAHDTMVVDLHVG